jgi:hypothetical protein
MPFKNQLVRVQLFSNRSFKSHLFETYSINNEIKNKEYIMSKTISELHLQEARKLIKEKAIKNPLKPIFTWL